MSISRKSPTPELIRKMDAVGMTQSEIVRKIGCTPQYVSTVLSEPGETPQAFVVPSLSADEWAWLRREAARLQVSIGECAKALLVDAINDAREQEP